MFPQSVSARKTMIFAVALVVSIFEVVSAGDSSLNMCGLQKNTSVQQYKLNTLSPFFGEVLTTESNNNIYVVSICQPVPKKFYDPKKLSGVIKLTPEGNTIDLGHINQSNVIVNENSIVLTYVGGDQDGDEEDTCRGLRWLTHLTFRCDPKANYDILTLIDEDPDQPEICQVWFEIRTSKICNSQSYLPFVIAGKDFSASKNQTDNEKHNARESTNSNEIPSEENEFDYDTSNIDNNNKTSNTENKEKPNINELYNTFKKSFRSEHFSTSKENKTTNDEVKNDKKPQIISNDQKKQSDNESKDNYKESVTEKNEKEGAKGSNSQTNTTENKMSADHEINKFWTEINNTVPGMPSNKEYSYPEKKEIISQYNNMKKYLNQSKNSEGKYENSVLRESTEDDENKDGKLNQKFPEDISKNDTKNEKPINNENMEKISRQNTFENQTSNKEMNDSNDNEKMLHQDGSKKSNLNNNQRTHNGIPNSDNGIKNNTTNEGKIADIEDNQNQLKDNTSIIYDNNVPSDKTKENIANKTHLQNNSSESKSFKKEDQKNEIENHPNNVNSSITENTPRADSTTENISTGSGHKDVDANTISTPKPKTNYGNPTIDANKNNSMKNNYNSTSGNDDNTIAVIVKPSKTSPSNTVVNDNTNESGEVNVSSTDNSIKTNNKSELNGTIINETNKVNKNLQPDILSDGIHISASIIILALVLLVVVIVLIGTAINRYYYKLSGTDQIPFKGTMRSIYNFFKVIILSICCCYCCRSSSYDDLEAPNLTNEKTPLLQPKFNISSPLLEDETSKKSSDSGANDDNNKQNSNKEYGSMSKEKKSSTSEIKYQDINIGGNVSTTFTEKVKSAINSITEKVGGKVETTDEIQKDLDKITKDAALISKFVKNEKSTVITEKVEGKVESTDEIQKDLDKITKDSALISKFVENEKSTVITEKVGGKVESTDEIQKDLDKITKDSALISKFVENEKSTVITDDVRVDVEIIPENNLEKTHLNGIETQNVVVQEDVKSITLGESQQSSNVTPLSEVIVSQVSVSDLQQIKKNEQASEKTSTVDRVETEELIESTHKKKDINIENNIEINLDTVVTSTTDNKTSINESKLMSLGFEKEDKNVQKVVTNKSISSNKKIENEEDDVEVIEEIIYVDGVAGEEDEEIIEEIIETTTIEDSPDLLGESIHGSGHTKVTVHTTRKISSTSLPGEVKTTEETVVTDGIPEIERKLSGFHLGIGKSGVSMSVDDKKMEIGKSGLDFIPSRNKSPTNVEGDAPDKRDKRSPEKSKNSATLSKVFKRSISHPTDDDIQEVEDESASTRKFSVTSSGLLKSGKSRSKSTLIVKTGDVTIDTKEMSNFMEIERKVSRTSNVGLGELDLTVSDEGVAAAVVVGETSTTTSEGKDTPASSSESAKDLQSTENAETKSDAQTKREKKDKTKLTTLSRPF